MEPRKNLAEDKNVDRNMVCTIDINIAADNTKTLSINYRYLTDLYHEDRIEIADLPKSFKAVEKMMNRYMAKGCGKLFSTGYLKNIDFTIRELSGDNIYELYEIKEDNITDNDTRKVFKAVEKEVFHFLAMDKVNSHKLG